MIPEILSSHPYLTFSAFLYYFSSVPLSPGHKLHLCGHILPQHPDQHGYMVYAQ